jgi:predicted amidohydrolase
MASDVLRFSSVQLSSQDDLAKNLARASELIHVAAEEGAQCVLLPENFAYFGSPEGKRDVAEPLARAPHGPIFEALARAASRAGAYVIAGGMPERSADRERPYNSCVVVAPDGALAGCYRKIHLFDVDVGDGRSYCESASTTAGSEPLVVDLFGFRVGLSVCYDLRFPELYRQLVARGAEVLVVPAAFTQVTGQAHWHVLLRARAIESQCYVVAAAQSGEHPGGRRTFGYSLAVDPWGEVKGERPEGEGVVTVTIDRTHLERIRAKLPSLAHRRL